MDTAFAFPSLMDFTGVAGQDFMVGEGDVAVRLTLAKVTPQTLHPSPSQRTEPFALTFKSDTAEVLPQGTYELRNATLGALPIFIVPVAREDQGIVYEAIFA